MNTATDGAGAVGGKVMPARAADAKQQVLSYYYREVNIRPDKSGLSQ